MWSTRSTQTSPTFFRQISENDSPAIFLFPTKNLRRNSNSLNPSSPFRSLPKLKYNAAIAFLLSFCTASILVRSYCTPVFRCAHTHGCSCWRSHCCLIYILTRGNPSYSHSLIPVQFYCNFWKFCLNFLHWYNFNCDFGG